MGLWHGSLKNTMEEFDKVRKSSKPDSSEKDPGTAESVRDWEEKEQKPNALAMFIAALIVTIPVLLLATGLMLLAFWLFI